MKITSQDSDDIDWGSRTLMDSDGNKLSIVDWSIPPSEAQIKAFEEMRPEFEALAALIKKDFK